MGQKPHIQGQMKMLLTPARIMIRVLARLNLSRSKAKARGPQTGIHLLGIPGLTRMPKQGEETAELDRHRAKLNATQNPATAPGFLFMLLDWDLF